MVTIVARRGVSDSHIPLCDKSSVVICDDCSTCGNGEISEELIPAREKLYKQTRRRLTIRG